MRQTSLAVTLLLLATGGTLVAAENATIVRTNVVPAAAAVDDSAIPDRFRLEPAAFRYEEQLRPKVSDRISVSVPVKSGTSDVGSVVLKKYRSCAVG